MKLTYLGSGSGGNAALLQTASTLLLIDCGLTLKTLRARMAPLRPEQIDAVLISHEHGDHVKGLNALLQHQIKCGRHAPVYAASMAISSKITIELPNVIYFQAGIPFSINKDIHVDPFTTMHDCAEPVAFKFTANEQKIGFAVDLGFIPPALPFKFRDCQVIVIESNHDIDMLMNGPHTDPVKARVSGRGGHLSNQQVAEYLSTGLNGATHTVCLAHLSDSSNTQDLAVRSAEAALAIAQSNAKVVVATQRETLYL